MEYLQEAVANTKRITMLDLFEEKTRGATKKTIVNRVTIVGKLRSNNVNKAELGEYYDKMFKVIQNNTKQPPYQERVTGVMIIYPTLMVHVIETSADVVKLVMKDMLEMFKNQQGLLIDAKILSVAHNIHTRLFPLYQYKMMNLSFEFDSSEPADSVETLVNETVTKLLRMGTYLSDNSKTTFKKEILENIHEVHPEYLPNQTYVNYLMRNDLILNVREYLDYHEKPLDIVFESDLTWPAPYKLFSYQ